MVAEKMMLSLEDIESQTAFELPDRETLDTIIVSCVAVCVGQVRIRDVNVNALNVAAAVCAALNTQVLVAALNLLFPISQHLAPTTQIFECTVQQTGPKQGG